MREKRLPTVVVVLCFAALCVTWPTHVVAGDWPHWRGPTFNGLAESPPLVEAFGEGVPKKVWESEPLHDKGDTGHGSVTVVDGRVYTFAYARFKEPLETRVLRRGVVEGAGYAPDMPKELFDAVEKARVSEERRAQKGWDPMRKWVDDWLKTHLKREHRKYRRAVQARLQAGDNALPMDVLAKLDEIKTRTFDNQAAYDAWLKQSQIDQKHHKAIDRMLVKDKDVSSDVVCCLDAVTGKALWKKQLDSWWMWWMASCTPTIVEGRCYVLSSDAKVYCLDAKTGEEIWKSEDVCHPRSKGNKHNRSSSVLIIDGVAIVATAGRTAGLDANTGKELWHSDKIKTEYGSAVPWTAAGKSYAVMVAAGKVWGVEPKTGNIAWSVKGSDGPTPTIVGDRMAVPCANKGGLTLYAMTDAEPEVLWSVPFLDLFSAPIFHDGHVYAFGEAYSRRGKGRALCVNIASGKVVWSEMLKSEHQHSSPVLADGKLMSVGGPTLYLVKATPEKYTELGKLRLGLDKYSSVSFADGKVYLRTGRSVVCYDLSK